MLLNGEVMPLLRFLQKSRMPFSFFVLCSLIGGILIQAMTPLYLSILISACLLVTCIFFLFSAGSKPHYFYAYICIFFYCLGAFRYHQIETFFSFFHARFFGSQISCKGTIIDIKLYSLKCY